MMSTKVNDFVKRLATTRTGPTLFNPYNELIKSLDDRTAPGVRQQNLRLYLNAHIALRTKMLWLYFAPTFSEARRSGVPLINAALFGKAENVLGATRHFEKATKSRKTPGNTVISSVLWNVASELGINPIIWPVIPFYPYERDTITVKRNPTTKEIIKHEWFLTKILDIYRPEVVFAIGKDTKDALEALGVKAEYIKHPRRGRTEFKKAIVRYI